jgi:hypothetical protein
MNTTTLLVILVLLYLFKEELAALSGAANKPARVCSPWAACWLSWPWSCCWVVGWGRVWREEDDERTLPALRGVCRGRHG